MAISSERSDFSRSTTCWDRTVLSLFVFQHLFRSFYFQLSFFQQIVNELLFLRYLFGNNNESLFGGSFRLIVLNSVSQYRSKDWFTLNMSDTSPIVNIVFVYLLQVLSCDLFLIHYTPLIFGKLSHAVVIFG